MPSSAYVSVPGTPFVITEPAVVTFTRLVFRCAARAADRRGRRFRGLGRFLVTRTRLRAPDFTLVTRLLVTFALPRRGTTRASTITGPGGTRRLYLPARPRR